MTVSDPPAPADAPLDGDRSALSLGGTSLFARHGLSNLDVLVIAAVAIAMCAYTPFFFTWFWAPRAILVLIVLPAGLLALSRLALDRDRAAVAGIALLIWALLCAALSGGFFASFSGFVGQDTSVLAWAGALGLYALGRAMSPAGRAAATKAAFAIVSLHALVGAAQMLFQIEDSNLGLAFNRSTGLTPNPVFFGGLMAMGVAYSVHRTARTDAPLDHWVAIAGLFGVVVSFSGSRVALVSTVIVAAMMLAKSRSRTSLVATVSVAAGVLIGTAFTRALGTGEDATSRLSQTNSGGRLTWWTAAWDSFLERPIFGWGLGRFRTAIQGELSFDYIASVENRQAQWDAHNLIISVVVALGIPGLLLLAAFIFFAARSAAGPQRIMVLAVALTWMLQPAALMTLPFALFLLGVATVPAVDSTHLTARVPAVLWGGAVVAGLVVGGWLAVAEFRLDDAIARDDDDGIAAATSMYLRDPVVNNVMVQRMLALEPSNPEFTPLIDEGLRRSTEYEPSRPLWWVELANRQGSNGDIEAAIGSARRALELQPTDSGAWGVLHQAASDLGDSELLAEADAAFCKLGFDESCAANE